MTDTLFLPHRLTQQYTYTYAASATIRYSQQITIVLISSSIKNLPVHVTVLYVRRATPFLSTRYPTFSKRDVLQVPRWIIAKNCDSIPGTNQVTFSLLQSILITPGPTQWLPGIKQPRSPAVHRPSSGVEECVDLHLHPLKRLYLS